MCGLHRASKAFPCLFHPRKVFAIPSNIQRIRKRRSARSCRDQWRHCLMTYCFHLWVCLHAREKMVSERKKNKKDRESACMCAERGALTTRCGP